MAFTAKIFANVRLTVHIFPLKSPENFSRSFFLFLQLTVQICQFLRLTGKFFTANAETHWDPSQLALHLSSANFPNLFRFVVWVFSYSMVKNGVIISSDFSLSVITFP